MEIKKIIADDVYLDNFGRREYNSEYEVDIPYFGGSFNTLIPPEFEKNATARVADRQFINNTLLFNETIPVGSKGLYYLILHKGYKIDQLLIEPDELKVDIFIHKDDRLIYSFYNPTKKDNITIKGRVSYDVDNVALKIKANLNDVIFRNYFIQLALENYGNETEIPEYFPQVMNAIQAASYLNTSEKTIRNWTSEKKIPFTKIGNTVKFRKKDLDEYLEKNTNRPDSKK